MSSDEPVPFGTASAATHHRRRTPHLQKSREGSAAPQSASPLPRAPLHLPKPPGGIKLHAELTFLLGNAATAALDAAQAAYAAAWPHTWGLLVWSLVAACALLGLCGGLAAAAAAARAVLLPLEAAYRLAAGLYRLHLRCLGAMWRLMRGKGGPEAAVGAARLQLLRRRRQEAAAASRSGGGGGGGGGSAAAAELWGNSGAGDSTGGAGDEVTAEHVIVGVLLFTPLLALLPTTAVWYLFACCLHFVPAAARGTLLAAAALAARNPACALLRRLLQPAAYPGGGWCPPCITRLLGLGPLDTCVVSTYCNSAAPAIQSPHCRLTRELQPFAH